MKVACPQCGAPVEALTETRFLRCPFCASSFTVQGGAGLLHYCFAHERDDRIAWSALQEHLEANGADPAIERDSIDLADCPFWLFTLDNGEKRMMPACRHPWGDLPAVTLPGGDLLFVPEGKDLPPPDIPLAEASHKLATGRSVRQSMVHLPLYFLDYGSAGHSCRAVVSAIDRKVYLLDSPVSLELHIPTAHIVMIAVFAAVLFCEGLAVRNLAWRGAAFAITCAVLYPIYFAMLKREV